MKAKKISISVSAVIAIALCVCLAIPVFAIAPQTAFAADYYSSVTATSGTALLGQLHDLIVSTHSYYTSYDDVKKYSQYSDPGKGSNTVLEFYTHEDIANSKWDVSGGWNREHVWAQSISNGLWGKTGAGSDMHHIRPSEKDINNHRGNKLYGEVSNGTPEYTSVMNVLGGHSNSSTFEPLDNVKGDVARIVMYVYTHYSTASNVGGTVECKITTGNLPITNIITASNANAAWQLLLKWNKLDPVDDIERVRNEYVYSKQGNRNPFIDNEQYANAIWGDGTVEDVKPQSISLSPTSLALAIGNTATLKVSASPAGASASVTWASSDSNVATVSNGVVTAKSAGTATITATSTVDSGKKASVTVTVREATAEDKTAINTFISSVSDIANASSLEAQYNAIAQALLNYDNLLDYEKNDSAVKAAYGELLNKVNEYNGVAGGRNEQYNSAVMLTAKSLAMTSLSLLALVVILKRFAK